MSPNSQAQCRELELSTANCQHKGKLYGRLALYTVQIWEQSVIVDISLPLSLKRKAHNHCTLPWILYGGAEAWGLTKHLEKKPNISPESHRKMTGTTLGQEMSTTDSGTNKYRWSEF